jgi:serine/threonine protein kinase
MSKAVGGKKGEDESSPVRKAKPAFATTALGPADIRDTPHSKPPPPSDEDIEVEGDDPWIGRTLSNVYRVESRIGEGGMGAVYHARHVHLQKSFAVKVLSDAISQKDNAVERLKQEAMAAAKIDHENIVEVVNFDRTDDGSVYIVMELLRGEGLADTIGRGPVELHRALPITYQICRALHAAHEHGIVHRDLKPENVFLSEKAGRTIVKVLDFGISKIKSADAEQVRMTRTGQLVGTPLYMSPEQARGETEIDRRVDVYAMGVILYEMLTGVPPFEGRNYFELLWKHGNEPPPTLKSRNPNVYIPDALEDVVAKALSKQRDERYETMAELEAALLQAVPEVPALAEMPSLPPERPSVPRTSSPDAKGGDRTTALEKPARSATTHVELPTRKPWPVIGAIAVLAFVGIAVIVWLSIGGDDPAPRRPEPVASAPEEAAPEEPSDPEPAPGVDPPPAPSVHSISLTSSPEGAEVRLGDRVLGTTPLTVPLPASDEAVRLTFAMEGFLERTISVIPAEGLDIPEVRLTRRRRAETTSGGTNFPIKTGL